MMSKPIVSAIACIALAGCASTPDVQYRYFAAQATTSVSVTQTVDCRADKTLNIVHVPSVTTSYSSNRDKPHTLRTNDFKSSTADTDVKFDWFDDGRLKSVNLASTGQGESIVKAALSLVAAVGGAGKTASKADCDTVAALGGGKPVVIFYEGIVTYAKGSVGEIVPLGPTTNSRETHQALKSLLPELDFRVQPWQTLATVAESGESPTETQDIIPLTLHKTALAAVDVRVNKTPLWTGKVVVPTDETYDLPIPKPKLFGQQKFALVLNDAGGVTSLGYMNTSGTAAGLNTFTAMAGAVAPSDATKAAALKAEADLIAQTTRLAACQAKPADCK